MLSENWDTGLQQTICHCHECTQKRARGTLWDQLDRIQASAMQVEHSEFAQFQRIRLKYINEELKTQILQHADESRTVQLRVEKKAIEEFLGIERLKKPTAEEIAASPFAEVLGYK